MIKAIEWIRVSTKEQASDDRAGLQRQIEANAITAKRHSLEIIERIQVIDVSQEHPYLTPHI